MHIQKTHLHIQKEVFTGRESDAPVEGCFMKASSTPKTLTHDPTVRFWLRSSGVYGFAVGIASWNLCSDPPEELGPFF